MKKLIITLLLPLNLLAAGDDNLTLKASEAEKGFRAQVIAELADIREKIQQTDPDVGELKSNILKQIENDRLTIAPLKTQLTGRADCHWNLKTHKLLECLDGAQSLIEGEFYQILTGALITGYETVVDFIPRLGDQTTIWGNSKGTYLKTALYLYMKALKLPLPNIDTTALYHVTPLPDGIDITGCSFAFSDPKTPNGLIFPHSGYAFGGHRNEARYPTGKKFGPEDCSSWVQKTTGCGSAFSTMDMLYAYRLQAEPAAFRPFDWNHIELTTRFKPVRDPQKDLQPGMIYASRSFKEDDTTMSQTPGFGGHTAIIWEPVTSSGQVTTIGANRDMPQLEGFGLQSFSWDSKHPKKVFYFSAS